MYYPCALAPSLPHTPTNTRKRPATAAKGGYAHGRHKRAVSNQFRKMSETFFWTSMLLCSLVLWRFWDISGDITQTKEGGGLVEYFPYKVS